MRTRKQATLRRTWIAAALQLVAIIIGLGALTVGATWYSKTVFHETTSHVEDEMASVTTLKSAIVEMSVDATPVMYGFEGSSTTEENLYNYLVSSERLTEELHAARRTFHTSAAKIVLDEMIETWNAIDAAVLEAPAMRASGELDALATAGDDPFAELVWAPYNELDRGLRELGSNTVSELRGRISDFDRIYGLIIPTVLCCVLLALVMSWRAGLRVSRRVVAPLAALRHAALAMRESHIDDPIVLSGAAAELNDLARTINETSASLRATHDELRDQATTDTLTGLPNRRAFTNLLEHKFANPNGTDVCVLFIDLDDFKVVNDSLGHAAGDELLCVVARRLRSVARQAETVARLGGDEFAIVLSANGSAAAIAVAERTLAALSDPVVINGTRVEVGCSIGFASSAGLGSGDDAADELVRNADFAMYMAKGQGKNRFEVFAPAMHAEMLGRMQLKHDLSQAVRLDQLVLEYQPVVQLDTRALIGFEALVRWQHPTRGRLAPFEFISLAEDTADIIAIGEWVMNEACRALAEHQRQQGPEERPLWMSVNVSPVEIDRPGFVETVNDIIQRNGIAPETLIIEITEGVAMTDTGAARRVLRSLRSSGVHVALDDFGTGFSTLRSLHELPIDVIKIDRSFVNNAVDDAEAQSMLEGIVTLGRNLGLDIIAEGIETFVDMDRLTHLGVAGQGFLFARPLSPADAAEYRENAPNGAMASLV